MNTNDPFNSPFFKNHNARIERQSKVVTRSFGAFIVLWLFWAAICLAGAAGLVYVAIHFISKFW